jgi:hypothetical protein
MALGKTLNCDFDAITGIRTTATFSTAREAAPFLIGSGWLHLKIDRQRP